MKVKWLGHSAFLITAEDGTRIVTDPFGEYGGLRYRPIEERADIVLVSHDHGDHTGGRVKGNPTKVSTAGGTMVRGIEIKGVETYHDASKGKERGRNTVFCFAVDGIRVCHLGDLGHELTQEEVSEIGQVDVLMIPVGGFFTIDAAQASRVCDQLKPRMVIPMHYKTPKCDFPIADVGEFLRGKSNVRQVGSSEVDLKKGQLPEATEVVVLEPAL